MAERLHEQEIGLLRLDLSNLRTDLAVALNRISNIERRCEAKETEIGNIKERRLRPIEAWQNRAIGYAAAFSFIASFMANLIVDYVTR